VRKNTHKVNIYCWHTISHFIVLVHTYAHSVHILEIKYIIFITCVFHESGRDNKFNKLYVLITTLIVKHYIREWDDNTGKHRHSKMLSALFMCRCSVYILLGSYILFGCRFCICANNLLSLVTFKLFDESHIKYICNQIGRISDTLRKKEVSNLHEANLILRYVLVANANHITSSRQHLWWWWKHT